MITLDEDDRVRVLLSANAFEEGRDDEIAEWVGNKIHELGVSGRRTFHHPRLSLAG